jgi:putative hemolysin
MSWIDPFSDGKTVSEFWANLVPATIPLKGDLRISNLEVRMAKDQAEVEAAQRLRFRVFYEEMEAQASPEQAATGRDIERLDPFCDHMLVIDHNKKGPDAIVGTYRMLRRSVADKHLGFYSSGEYDISKLLVHPGELLEVGRSCVDINYRTRPTLELLWRGIASYVDQYDIQLIFGCASFPVTDAEAIKDELAYLYYHHLAPPALRATALPGRMIAMDKTGPQTINPRRALSKLPPLIKGYLRIGGFVGDGAVLDEQWGSIDVCIIVKTDLITDRHAKHFGLTDGAEK